MVNKLVEFGVVTNRRQPNVLAATSWIGFGILLIGKRRIHGLRYVEEKDANLLPH